MWKAGVSLDLRLKSTCGIVHAIWIYREFIEYTGNRGARLLSLVTATLRFPPVEGMKMERNRETVPGYRILLGRDGDRLVI